jgi:cytochrome c-type biogenesis protein CcmH/NrfF
MRLAWLVLLLASYMLGPATPGLAQHPARHVDEEQVHTIATQLRCVVCQNLSVADSPS